MKRQLRRLLFLIVAAALSSCSSSPTAPTTVTSVTVFTFGTSSLSRIGEQTRLEASVDLSTGGPPLNGFGVTWQSSNTAVATVSPATQGAIVTAVAAGTVTISATYAGKTGTATITVAPGASTITATIDGDGAAFNAIEVWAGTQSGSIVIQSVDSLTQPPARSLSLSVPASVGMYQVGVPGSVAGVELTYPGSAWDTCAQGSSGTVTVSTVTPAGASGTFSVTLALDEGGSRPPTTKAVTGAFTVVF